MTVPEKITISELCEEARNSPLRKGMIVRCLSMGGSWSGFDGCEFYVLSDEAEPMWGHLMAIRHCYDVDPNTAQMLVAAKNEKGERIFYHTHLPASCVEILDQESWSEADANAFRAEKEWVESWEAMLQRDAEAYERCKTRWEETAADEDKRWMKIFSKRKIWSKIRNNCPNVFSPKMLEFWTPEKKDE